MANKKYKINKLREKIFANSTLGKSLKSTVRKVVIQISLQLFLIMWQFFYLFTTCFYPIRFSAVTKWNHSFYESHSWKHWNWGRGLPALFSSISKLWFDMKHIFIPICNMIWIYVQSISKQLNFHTIYWNNSHRLQRALTILIKCFHGPSDHQWYIDSRHLPAQI